MGRFTLDINKVNLLYGHDESNLIYRNSNKDKMYIYDGKESEALSHKNTDFNYIFMTENEGYIFVEDDRVIYITKNGKEKVVYEDDFIENAFYLVSEDVFFFKTDKDELYEYEPGKKKSKIISKDVNEIANSQESLMYLVDDTLMVYRNGKTKVVSKDVQTVNYLGR